MKYILKDVTNQRRQSICIWSVFVSKYLATRFKISCNTIKNNQERNNICTFSKYPLNFVLLTKVHFQESFSIWGPLVIKKQRERQKMFAGQHNRWKAWGQRSKIEKLNCSKSCLHWNYQTKIWWTAYFIILTLFALLTMLKDMEIWGEVDFASVVESQIDDPIIRSRQDEVPFKERERESDFHDQHHHRCQHHRHRHHSFASLSRISDWLKRE